MTTAITHAVRSFRAGSLGCGWCIELARQRSEMLTTVQARMRRTHAVLLVTIAALAFEACRGDDVVPDVFIDEFHCVREPDAAPFGMCDVPQLPDVTDATTQ